MYKKNLLTTIFSISILLAASAAVAARPQSIRNFDDYQSAALEQTEFMPSKEMVNDKQKQVAVVPIEILGSEPEESDRQIASLMRNRLEELVGKIATLMDRSVSSRLGSELARIELTEGNTPSGSVNTGNAQIAIVANIVNSYLTSEFKPASSGEGVFGEYSNPNTCVIGLSFETLVKIVNLENMEVQRVNKLGEGKVSVENTTCSNANQLAQANINSLASSAIDEVLREVYGPLSSLLVPTAYILERKTLISKGKVRGNLFRITLGDDDGIEEADDIAVFSKISRSNPLTGEVEIDRVKIADARMTDRVTAKSSWIFVKDAGEADKIRLGDIVEITMKSKGGGLFSFGKLFDELGL